MVKEKNRDGPFGPLIFLFNGHKNLLTSESCAPLLYLHLPPNQTAKSSHLAQSLLGTGVSGTVWDKTRNPLAMENLLIFVGVAWEGWSLPAQTAHPLSSQNCLWFQVIFWQPEWTYLCWDSIVFWPLSDTSPSMTLHTYHLLYGRSCLLCVSLIHVPCLEAAQICSPCLLLSNAMCWYLSISPLSSKEGNEEKYCTWWLIILQYTHPRRQSPALGSSPTLLDLLAPSFKKSIIGLHFSDSKEHTKS